MLHKFSEIIALEWVSVHLAAVITACNKEFSVVFHKLKAKHVTWRQRNAARDCRACWLELSSVLCR